MRRIIWTPADAARRGIGREVVRLLVVAALIVPPSHSARATEIDWERLEELRSAGDDSAALELVVSVARDSSTPVIERIRAARTEHELLVAIGRVDESQEAGLRWLALAEEVGHPEGLVAALTATGKAFAGQGKSSEAAPLFRRALELAGDIGDRESELDLLISLATAERGRARFLEAEKILDRAEALWAEEGDSGTGARLWNERASLLTSMGVPAEGIPHRRRARELAREAADRDLEARVTLNLGQTHMALHDYAEALALFAEARELEPRPRSRVILGASIGICHFELGDLDRAEEMFVRARREARDLGDPVLEGWATGEIGLVAWKRDADGNRALDLFRTAGELSLKAGDRRNALVWLANEAMVRRDQGRYEECLDVSAEAETLAASIAGFRGDPGLSKREGECLVGLGRTEDAETAFRRAIELAEATGNERIVWEGNWQLAKLLAGEERRQESRAAFERALDSIESLRVGLRLESFKTDFFEDKVRVYDDYVELLLGPGRSEESVAEAFRVDERSRARAFLDGLAEARAEVHETLPPEIVEEERRLLAEISRFQAEIRREGPGEDRTTALEAAEAELEDLALTVRVEFPRFADLRSPEPVGVDEVMAVLGPDEALLVYRLAEPVSRLWVVTGERVELAALPGASGIEFLVREAVAEILAQNDPEGVLTELAGGILGPVDPGTLPDSLVIVPSGILNYFPFEVLPFGDGRVVDTRRTSFVPSASTLVALRSRSPDAVERRVLALGDPRYAAGEAFERSTSLVGIDRLGALPHTRREVVGLTSRFEPEASTLLLGEAATETALKAESLESYGIIHLAAHGWIDPVSPQRCAIVLGREEGSAEDGILQVREIARLRMRAELVTLSACETALGTLTTGEGMVGLTRSFFSAGARSVVASLWRVDDEASALFMDRFYDSLAAGATKAEALRRARLDVREDPRYRTPYFWAPWVLFGEGGDGVEVPSSGPSLWWLVALGMVAVGVLLVLRPERSRQSGLGA